MNKKQPTISIVSTLYKSSGTVTEFISSICNHASTITNNFEIVLVDDGSPDDSVEIARKAKAPTRIIQLTKNFGHHHAMMAAIENARGDYVFLIDSDLEEDPSLILDFWTKFEQNSDADVIYGIQENRKGSLVEKLSGKMFYSIFNALSEIQIPPDLLTVRLMSRRYVETLKQYTENSVFIGGLWQIAGYKQLPLRVRKKSSSRTTYTLTRKLELVLNSITSFSSKPLLLLFKLSLFINVITLLYIARNLYYWFEYDETMSGYSSIIISIWMFGGLLLSATSIIGLYLSKIFTEVKNRPRYSIKEIIDRSPL